MEIVDPNSGTLCNFEVRRHLQKVKGAKRKHKGQLATITYETLKYLDGTACAEQIPANVTACIRALAPFNLTKNEKLMLVNTPPSTNLEIQVIIEDSTERLTDEQVNEILEIVAKHFPHVAVVKVSSSSSRSSD